MIGLKADPGFLFPCVARLYCSSSKGIPEAITSIAPVELLISVITPVGFGSSVSSSNPFEGTHLFRIWFACSWYSKFKVIYKTNDYNVYKPNDNFCNAYKGFCTYQGYKVSINKKNNFLFMKKD